jgi:hypothetical protein
MYNSPFFIRTLNNLVIKTHHTLRSRLSLSHYIHDATTMLNQWSIDRNKPENMFKW